MRIEGIVWLDTIVDKLFVKHRVLVEEVEEVFLNQPSIRFAENGDRPGEDVYLALGRTDEGRYLSIYFIYKLSHEALILSAREMAPKERRLYAR